MYSPEDEVAIQQSLNELLLVSRSEMSEAGKVIEGLGRLGDRIGETSKYIAGNAREMMQLLEE